MILIIWQSFQNVCSFPSFINDLIDDITGFVDFFEGTANPDGDLELLANNTALLFQCSLCIPTLDPVCVLKCGSFYGSTIPNEIFKSGIQLVKAIMSICLEQPDNAYCSFDIKSCLQNLGKVLLEECLLL